MTIFVHTPCGTEFKISECDLDLVLNPRIPWRLTSHGYIWQTSPHLYLHRAVAARVAGRRLRRKSIVDHVNGDKLDNTRENLRLVTSRKNVLNRHTAPRGEVPYWGVALVRESGNFRAYINANGVQKALGVFATAVEAAHAYNVAATDEWGVDATLNDVPVVTLSPITHEPSASGLPVGIRANGQRFIARAKVQGREIHIGTYDTIQDAVTARNLFLTK